MPEPDHPPAPSPPPLLAPASALFLDFDGTLAPIAACPQDVLLPAWVMPLLRRLRPALGNAVAILSGRPLAQLDAFLEPLRLPAAGVHGLQRRSADGHLQSHPADPPVAVIAAMQGLVARHPQLLFEPKPGAVALHFRAAPQLAGLCRDALDAALVAQPEWMVLSGHAVFEVKPRRWSKASALQAFMLEPPFAGRTPIVVGDDVTDEDAMRAADAAHGHGVRIGAGPSQARHRLADPAAVGDWLGRSAAALEAAPGR